ncbi:uncharacterized protein E0L32_002519 [Thyridium curvatum]|uniref:Uncharacterized protein n=1 Tax=Thyridium curvatum TaxID=1093900 RepID=A0A507B8M4_9PEZI|nr:uncharacterized protein E0L32_002519 [Thyridium curvatum]TPX18662.1 hypothetical protein E0L32_002519 [Thyridium curvatum]
MQSFMEKHHTSKETSEGASTTASRIAGNVQTCSIRDFQVDYLTIVRDSATSYHLALTVDPAPLYRIELVPASTKIGDIQIYSASDSTLPALAAARISANPKNKSEPLATICTSSPTQPDAVWRPLTRAGTFSAVDYRSEMPIVTVPGRPATLHQFSWRTGGLSDPFCQVWWDGPLPLVPVSMFTQDQRGSEYVFATIARKTATAGDNLVEIRRGGGLEFELSVILGLFAILHFKKERLL